MMKTMKILRTAFEIPKLGEKIRDARFDAKKKGKKLKDICEEVGMSTQNWYLIEKGITQELPEETLIKIEKSLGVDLRANFNNPIAV